MLAENNTQSLSELSADRATPRIIFTLKPKGADYIFLSFDK